MFEKQKYRGGIIMRNIVVVPYNENWGHEKTRGNMSNSVKGVKEYYNATANDWGYLI